MLDRRQAVADQPPRPQIPTPVRRALVPLLLVASFLLAACGEGLAYAVAENPPPDFLTTPTTECLAPSCQVIDVTMSDFKIVPSSMTTSASRVRFRITNEGTFTHSLELALDRDPVTSPNIGPGQTGYLDVDVRPGTHTLTCPITGHAVRGQRATLEVTGG